MDRNSFISNLSEKNARTLLKHIVRENRKSYTIHMDDRQVKVIELGKDGEKCEGPKVEEEKVK